MTAPRFTRDDNDLLSYYIADAVFDAQSGRESRVRDIIEELARQQPSVRAEYDRIDARTIEFAEQMECPLAKLKRLTGIDLTGD